MNARYTEKQWEEEMNVLPAEIQPGSAFGRILPCPWCKTVGFYGPRKSVEQEKITRKYRACKFCGFWQEVWGEVYNEIGGKPYRCIHFYCDRCQRIDTYNWTMPEAKSIGHCPRCDAENKKTKWASDNPNHPFHKLKEILKNW